MATQTFRASVPRAQGPALAGPLEACRCDRYRFAVRCVAERVVQAYGGSCRVVECPSRGYHVVGQASKHAMP